MTAATVPAPARLRRARRIPLAGAARLLWLELRRSIMPWLVPLFAVLFWVTAYRPAVGSAPLWAVRATTLQAQTLLAFAPLLAGVAAWAGAREGRRGTTDMVAIAGLPRWAGRLTAWAAMTCWAEAVYLAGVAALYGVTAGQASWGGPLWWPVAAGAVTAAAACALGFAAGAVAPSRFTAPLAAAVVFVALGSGAIALQDGAAYAQIWPLNVQGPFPHDSYGVFYPYLHDLAIAQIMFTGGLAAAALGVLGLPALAGGGRLRAAAAAVTLAGLGAAGTAVGLAGTARIEAHGIVIPALHDAASDRPVPYTPVCGSSSGVPVCLQPAYRAYLPDVTAALSPLLREISGLPGMPARVIQVAETSVTPQPDNGIAFGGPVISGSPPVIDLPLSGLQLPGGGTTPAGFTQQLRAETVPLLGAAVGLPPVSGLSAPVSTRPGALAQLAVANALAQDAGLLSGALAPAASAPGTQPGQPLPGVAGGRGPRGGGATERAVAAASRRFAALPSATRRAWLISHLSALRSGQVTLSEVP